MIGAFLFPNTPSELFSWINQHDTSWKSINPSSSPSDHEDVKILIVPPTLPRGFDLESWSSKKVVYLGESSTRIINEMGGSVNYAINRRPAERLGCISDLSEYDPEGHTYSSTYGYHTVVMKYDFYIENVPPSFKELAWLTRLTRSKFNQTQIEAIGNQLKIPISASNGKDTILCQLPYMIENRPDSFTYEKFGYRIGDPVSNTILRSLMTKNNFNNGNGGIFVPG